MGSDSDLPVVRKAIDTLASFDVPYEVHIYSAHRTPVEARDFALSARDNGFGVLIAAAGMAAHLAGAIAANTTLPVIGIPCKGPVLDGMDALLATVQMPTAQQFICARICAYLRLSAPIGPPYAHCVVFSAPTAPEGFCAVLSLCL